MQYDRHHILIEMAQNNRVLSPAEVWLRNSLKKHSLALSSLSRTMTQLTSRIFFLEHAGELRIIILKKEINKV
jgi:hypothetical protein